MRSVADLEYGNRRRDSLRELLLETMDTTIPGDRWAGLIEPRYYPDSPGERGCSA